MKLGEILVGVISRTAGGLLIGHSPTVPGGLSRIEGCSIENWDKAGKLRCPRVIRPTGIMETPFYMLLVVIAAHC